MRKHLIAYYNVLFAFLAILSVILVVLDLANKINLDQSPYVEIDWSILGVFAVDYLVRLKRAPKKKEFFIHTIFDLLAIIPVNAFAFFRIFRTFRILRLLRLFRLTGMFGILQKRASKFLHRGGLIYYLWLSLALIIISSAIYSFSEKASFPNSLWWSIVTATTVGYGDISPHTLLGRIVAVLLMINGIGLIGTLTSSITAYLADDNSNIPPIADELTKLHELEMNGGLSHEEYETRKQKLLK